MQLSDIRDEVQLGVNDVTFTDLIVNRYINSVYYAVVARCLVPEMKGMDTVTTSVTEPYCSLSSVSGGFSGVLSRVYGASSGMIKIFNKLEDLMDLNGNLTEVGSVEAVALEGSVLWYTRTPAVAEVLTLIYYRNPEELAGDSDTPDALPEFLHREILVNGAKALCFNDIEKGVEGLKVNTKAHEFAMETGVVRFREWLGKTRKHYVNSQEPA